MTEQMSDVDNPRRDSDEMSVASDFSIIPESFTGQEDISPGDQRVMAQSMASYQSEHFQSTPPETKFGKVLFQNVQATYTADSDIAVSYVLTPSVTAKSSDRVALYRVGFGSPQDYLTYQWAPTPSRDHTTNQLPMTVVFKASSLPKDAGEFFQFCYVTHEGQIVGVSTPFQLHPVGSSNVCGVDDGEDGMVMVCTKESVLHDKINKLTTENEGLLLELSDLKAASEKKQSELDDKVQQLNMCQHHLQALEAKMKKETSEKCELMGRVGQVVEEKGHLEDRLKTLERNLEASTVQIVSLEDKITKITEEKKEATEETLRLRKHKEQLEHALQKCQRDLSGAEENIKTLQAESESYKSERDNAIKELEFWTTSAATDKDEKNSLALKFSTVNEELITKLEELEKTNRLNADLEARLATAVVEMTSVKNTLAETEEKMSKAEEEKTIHEERLNVVNQDNEQLKVKIQQLKNKVESLESVQGNDESGREAAERIASDLSGRLQTAKAEYHALALTNLRLVKKIKKLRQSGSPEVDRERLSSMGTLCSMGTSMSSQGGSWLAVGDVDQEKNKDGDDDTGTVAASDAASCLIRSCTSAVSATTCSSCSHSTQMLSEAVHKKMEDIVRELSLQIQSLKSELKAREREEETRSLVQGETVSSQEPIVPVIEEQQQQQPSMENRQEEQSNVQEVVVGQAQSTESRVDVQNEPSTENSTDQQVLYGNSFLPAQRTAPVFLPERERQASPNNVVGEQDSASASVRPSAPSPTPSMLSQRGQSTATPPVMIVSTAMSGSLFAPKAHLPVRRLQPIPGSILPPPLLPETTPTARQAAVMSQFSSQQVPSGHGHESDDDDFHSTSDNDDTPNITNEMSSSLFECPMCGMAFQQGALRLLEEHINSHLEHVCPICSMAFQRNESKKFEEHVHAHFADEVSEDDNPLDDPSGPWAYRSTRLLEID
ncbi:tax1-binding protein 1 homolog isoform X2 [Palaemon carinicauda]|uniref:tax1-binding protein 1 homolog isoform X2 n=1 Tax=Palaemon carinicauda TaxID=392227 RepID=UPI0035B5875B